VCRRQLVRKSKEKKEKGASKEENKKEREREQPKKRKGLKECIGPKFDKNQTILN
jgi:hypothetical protein